MLNGATAGVHRTVPTVELALVIKALAYGSRLQARDVEDIYRLLEIVDNHPPDEIGGWRLNETPLTGLAPRRRGTPARTGPAQPTPANLDVPAGTTRNPHRVPGHPTRLTT